MFFLTVSSSGDCNAARTKVRSRSLWTSGQQYDGMLGLGSTRDICNFSKNKKNLKWLKCGSKRFSLGKVCQR